MRLKGILEIEGAERSGSGTIVRYGLSLASILGRPVHIQNIRVKRRKPGLRPQHLQAVQACSQLTGGRIKGATLGSKEIVFSPGEQIQGGNFSWDIGTAGSTTMLALCLLPLGLFAQHPSSYRISGGLFQDFAPCAFHMQYVLLPLLKRFSVQADIEIIRPGYVPTGGGAIRLEVKPIAGRLAPLRLGEQGRITAIKGIALSSHLQQRKVSQRMADACNKVLTTYGYRADIDIMEDTSAGQKGAALFIYALTDKGCILGADMAGKPGRTSEEIGKRVAKNLLEDLRAQATVDRFSADQLILYAALAEGMSEYIIPRMTEHIDTNLWLVEKILSAKVSLQDQRLKIAGIGLGR